MTKWCIYRKFPCHSNAKITNYDLLQPIGRSNTAKEFSEKHKTSEIQEPVSSREKEKKRKGKEEKKMKIYIGRSIFSFLGKARKWRYIQRKRFEG